MASIEEELKSTNFPSEQVKSNLNILFTSNWLNNQVSTLLKPFNVTPEQYNVLRILKGQHPNSICQKEILSRMIAKQSNITLIIRKLKDKKLVLVERLESDRRHYEITISDSALQLLADIDVVFDVEMPKINNLSVSEAFHLNSLLDKARGV